MKLLSLSKEAKKMAGQIHSIISRRNKGSYLFFNDAMTSIHALENREANMDKIMSRKLKNVILGYYGNDASRKSIERDILRQLSEHRYKAVDE